MVPDAAMAPAPSPPRPAAVVGIGLKAAHVAQVLQQGARVDFFEVHAENYMVAGGPYLAHLGRVRERWPLSLHGVGLSLGGAGPIDRAHLERLARLVERFEPRWVSEHLAWSGHGGAWLDDLLPLPSDPASLRRVCAHVDQLQQRLKRPVLIENPSTYVEFRASTMDEGQFLAELVRRTGCGLLLDVNNLYLSAHNLGTCASDYLDAFPVQAITEIHLAGHHADPRLGDALLIDSHDAPVAEPVWALYERLIARTGPRPTLIERDDAIPPLYELLTERERAHSALTNLEAMPCA